MTEEKPRSIAIFTDSRVSPWSRWMQIGMSGCFSKAASQSFLRYIMSEYLRAPREHCSITGDFNWTTAFMIPWICSMLLTLKAPTPYLCLRASPSICLRVQRGIFKFYAIQKIKFEIKFNIY
eukprot:XP_001710049.1 Hypothetical protein GL50803_31580 [Giardia lamblia ATCC 50803]